MPRTRTILNAGLDLLRKLRGSILAVCLLKKLPQVCALPPDQKQKDDHTYQHQYGQSDLHSKRQRVDELVHPRAEDPIQEKENSDHQSRKDGQNDVAGHFLPS